MPASTVSNKMSSSNTGYVCPVKNCACSSKVQNKVPYVSLAAALEAAPDANVLYIKRMTVEELDTLPSHIEHLHVRKVMPAVGPASISRRRTADGYKFKYSAGEVSNLPASLVTLTINKSFLPEYMFRLPYGCTACIAPIMTEAELEREMCDVVGWDY